ncbi:hypothetical protein SAY86_005158 [Trapa natans]|nr:hypothetical protein SAY86_005158 [Trapa natans]
MSPIKSMNRRLLKLMLWPRHSRDKRIRISEEDYVDAFKEEFNKVVKLQEELDYDVLVHPEWESYGSGSVKPPIINGDDSCSK